MTRKDENGRYHSRSQWVCETTYARRGAASISILPAGTQEILDAGAAPAQRRTRGRGPRGVYDASMVNDASIAGLLLEEVPGIVAAYRFGSTADGSARPDSDVDVAVLPPAPLAGQDVLRIAAAVAVLCRREVDLVDLLRVLDRSPHADRVARHRPAARRSGAHGASSRTASATQDYARLNEERRAILEQVAREGTVHGR